MELKGKELRELRHSRVKSELSVEVLKLINDFDSKEEPGIKLSEQEKVFVLSNIITKKLERTLS